MSGGQLCINNAARGTCAVCKQEGAQPCGRCRVDFYCSKNHQRQDWARHRKGCGVLELRVSERLGRHLVTNRDVPCGTVLLRELPLVAFPRSLLDPGQMLCISCCVELEGGPAQWLQCENCGWPVCSAECSRKPVHQPECTAFKRAKFRVKDVKMVTGDWLSAVACLRTCLIGLKDPRLWNLQGSIEDGLKSQEQSQDVVMGVYLLQLMFDRVVRWLRQTVGITWISEDDLLRAVAINNLNQFAENARACGSSIRPRWRADVYCGLSMVEHSCTPNATTVTEDPETDALILVAARDIKREEHISVDYLDLTLQCTETRRLQTSRRAFWCWCDLCEDPTEMGLYLGSWCCTQCSKAEKRMFVVRGVCEGCGRKESSKVIANLKEEFHNLKKKQKVAPARWEKYIKSHIWPRGPLHPTHHLILNAKKELVNTLMQEMQEKRPDIETVRHWEALCRDVLDALDVLRPGINSHRFGILQVLYYLLLAQSDEALKAFVEWKRPILPFLEEIRRVLADIERHGLTALDKTQIMEHSKLYGALFYMVQNSMYLTGQIQ